MAMEAQMQDGSNTTSQHGDYNNTTQQAPADSQGQQRYPGIMPGPAMAQQHSGPTPTLNQLLTQNPQQVPQSKYQPYQPTGQYDQSWQGNMGQQPRYPTPHMNPHQMGSQQGAPPMQGTPMGTPSNGPHMAMYDRSGGGGMPPSYSYGMQQSPYRRGSYSHQQNQDQMVGEMGDHMTASSQQQQHPGMARPRSQAMPGQHPGMMGPPRVPGSHHQMDTGSQMMPPPSAQNYHGMNSQYGNQQMRASQPGHPMYGNYPAGQQMMGRMPSQNSYGGVQNVQQVQMPPQSHMSNGPMYKGMPASPGAQQQSKPIPPSPAQQQALSPHVNPHSPAPGKDQKHLPQSPGTPSTLGGQKSMPPSPIPAVTPKTYTEQSTAGQASPHSGPSPRPDNVQTPKSEPTVSPRPDNQYTAQLGQQTPIAQPVASTQQLPQPAIPASHFHTNSTGGPMQQQYPPGPGVPQGYPQQQQGGPPGQYSGYRPTHVSYPPSQGSSPYNSNQAPGPYAPGAGSYPVSSQTAGPYPVPSSSQGSGPYSLSQGPGPYPTTGGQWMPSDQNPAGRSSPAVFNKGGVNSPMPSVGSPNVSVASPRPMKRPPSIAPSPTASSTMDDKSRSPSWPGTPKVKEQSSAPSNPDLVAKQLAFGEEPERRSFMEHLCAFYSEVNSPLTTAPTMGKVPLDLWKTYISVKERGGFQQVCKRKQWKQVGNLLTVGASTNAAFTLKKAYIKYLLPYECRFERGGIDPQTVVAAVDTKKDKRTAPSPAGSSNSQDAFMRQPGYHPDYGPGGHMTNQHLNHQGMHPMNAGYTQQQDPMHQQQQYMGYNGTGMPNGMPGHMPHNAMPPHGAPHGHPQGVPSQRSQYGMMGGEEQYHGGQSDGGNRFQQQQQPMMNPNQYPHQQQGSHTASGAYPQRPPYYGSRGGMPQHRAGDHMRPPFHQTQQHPGQSPQQHPRMRMPTPHHPPHSQGPAAGYHPSMYRDSNSYPAQNQQCSSSQPMSNFSPGMDNRSSNHMLSSNGATTQISMQQPSPHSIPKPQHGAMRYPAPMRSSYVPSTPRGALSQMLTSSAGFDPESLNTWCDIMPPPPPPDSHDRHGVGSPWSMRGPRPSSMRDGSHPGYPSNVDLRRVAQAQSMSSRHAPASKKEIIFPAGSVESRRPNQFRRKLLLSKDIGKIDPARLIMCLKSGLLCETVWALDFITILLHDNTTVQYFSLAKLPALLGVLLVHYKQALSELFEELTELSDTEELILPISNEESEEMDPDDKEVMLNDSPNYTLTTRKGVKVIIEDSLREDEVVPLPSMYNKKHFVNDDTDSILQHAYEVGNNAAFYKQKFFGVENSNLCTTKILTRDLLNNNNVIVTTSTSPEHSSPEVKHENTNDVPLCNGDVIKTEAVEKESIQDTHADDVKVTSSEGKEEMNTGEADVKPIVENSGPAKPKEMSLAEIEERLRHSRKRRFSDSIDDEPVVRDTETLQYDVDLRLEELAAKCVTIANIIRSLSYIQGNDKLIASNPDLLNIFGSLLNLRLKVDPCTESRSWWWNSLDMLREHTLITLSNVAGYIDLLPVPDKVCMPLLDSLLFWATSCSAYAKDSMLHSPHLTIQHLVMEILCKLCAHADNIDLLLATPPWDRMMILFQTLTKNLSDRDQVVREFSVVVISCLAVASPAAARGLALQPSCISQLISMLESAESAAMTIAHQQGIHALRDNPDAMGTSLDMIRRTAVTLSEMSKIPENIAIVVKQQDRLLNLVMSQILDQHVAKMLSDVLFECSASVTLPEVPASIRENSDEVTTKEETDQSTVMSEPASIAVNTTEDVQPEKESEVQNSPQEEENVNVLRGKNPFMNSVNSEPLVAAKDDNLPASQPETMVC